MYLDVAALDAAVVNLSNAYQSLTQLITLPNPTIEGRTCHALRIGAGANGSRDVMMAIGGQHAREWGSCEILLFFASDLLEAYTMNTGLAYGPKTFTAAEIKGIVDTLHVVIFPCVNPDGRQFDMDTWDPNGSGPGWRKNRNPAYFDGTPQSIGADLNRNYDFLHDYRTEFDPVVYTDPSYVKRLSVSDNPQSERYQGPSPFSEPESQNVRWLLDAFPRTRWFFDVHSVAGMVLYNWGNDQSQSSDPDKNFRNDAHDGTRGKLGDAYAEYKPAGDDLIEYTLGTRMRDAIAAVRGQTYAVGTSYDVLYATCGSSKDYAYARHFVDPGKSKALSYTIEWGNPVHGFKPDWPEMEEVIKEVDAGLIQFCIDAPCAGGLNAVSLETATLNFIDVPANEQAVRAVVFTVQSCSAASFTADPPVKNGGGQNPFSLPLGNMQSLPAAPNADPRQVRIWVAYQSNSPNNVSTGSVTVHGPGGQDFVIQLVANTSQPVRVASVLALDKSASMQWDSGIPNKKRIDVLHDSAPVFAQLLPNDHAIGIVAFDHDANPVTAVQQSDQGGQAAAVTAITNHQPNPMGNTAIGDGLELAHNTLQPLAGFNQKAIVVFTDGHETASKYIADVQNLINERVFALGLGTAAQLNPIALNKLVANSDGYLMLTGDLNANDDLRVEKYFSQILAGVSNADVVVDPEGWLQPGQVHKIPFTITEADRSATVFMLSPYPSMIEFALITPDGSVIDPAAAAALPAVDFVTAARVHQYRMSFPVPVAGGASAGVWHAALAIPRDAYKTHLASADRSPVGSAAVHGIHYSVNVHALSTLRMGVHVLQTSNEPGAEVTLHATLTESGVPVDGRAAVVAEIERPDKLRKTVALKEVDPGEFQHTFTAGIPGIYPVRFRASGTTLRGLAFTREQLRTAFVWKGGDDPAPTGPSQEPLRDIDLCKLLNCLLRQDGVVQWLKRQEIDVEEMRRCVAVACRFRRDNDRRVLIDKVLPLLEGSDLLERGAP